MTTQPEPFEVWKFLWTKRRPFLLVHLVVAVLLLLMLIINILIGTVQTAHYRYIVLGLLLFQATFFALDLLWSVRDQRDRARRRREEAEKPQDAEDDGFW